MALEKFLSWIGAIFPKNSQIKILRDQLESVIDENKRIKEELAEIKSRLGLFKQKGQKQKGFSHHGRPERYGEGGKPGGVVTDIHGNVIPVQGGQSAKWGTQPAREIMETKGTATPTLNVRRCRVWGCIGMNEIDGYCRKHYQKLKQTDPKESQS